MSPSSSSEATDPDRLPTARSAATGKFMALMQLTRFGEVPALLSCAFRRVIGDGTRWPEMCAPIDRSRKRRDATAPFAAARLRSRIDEATANRVAPSAAGFHDPRGRAIRIGPTA